MRIVEDWRERWEEKDARECEVITVLEHKGVIRFVVDVGLSSGWATFDSQYLIPKSRPKQWRQWEKEEVPVGTVVRHKKYGTRCAITSDNDTSYWFNNYVLAEGSTPLPDGTWTGTPCGVEVGT